jgi:hypothetical protein
VFAAVALAAMPAATLAQVHGGGAPPARPAPPPRAVAPAPARPAPPARPVAPARPVVIPRAVPRAEVIAPFARASVTSHESMLLETGRKSWRGDSVAPAEPVMLNIAPPNYKRAMFVGSVRNGPFWNRFVGPQFYNPHRWHRWGWNNYVVWYPAQLYWGGGFWGPYALNTLYSASPFGYYQDDQEREYYPSFETTAGSAGSELLQNYGLQQTACGEPNLVVIWGPRNSVICAIPNDLVPAGNYRIDPATLTLQAAY